MKDQERLRKAKGDEKDLTMQCEILNQTKKNAIKYISGIIEHIWIQTADETT